MNFLKILIIAFVAFFSASHLFGQSFPLSPNSCASNLTMAVESYKTQGPEECFIVTLSSPTPVDFYVLVSEHCITESSETSTTFSADVCYGEGVCGPDNPSSRQWIECGILDKDGGVQCYDGCVVTLDDGG